MVVFGSAAAVGHLAELVVSRLFALVHCKTCLREDVRQRDKLAIKRQRHMYGKKPPPFTCSPGKARMNVGVNRGQLSTRRSEPQMLI